MLLLGAGGAFDDKLGGKRMGGHLKPSPIARVTLTTVFCCVALPCRVERRKVAHFREWVRAFSCVFVARPVHFVMQKSRVSQKG